MICSHQMLQNHFNIKPIFIFIAVLFFYKLNAEKITTSITLPEESVCDQNKFFLCPTDNQCIPREWLADGEIDCKDGTDESEAIFNALQHQNNTNTIKSKQSSTNDDSANEKLTEKSSSVESNNKNNKKFKCSSKQKSDVLKCGNDLITWLTNLHDFYHSKTNISKISLFQNQENLSKIQQGCDFMIAYLACTSNYPASCDQLSQNTDEISKELAKWFSIQMYMCEFIVPSIKEHSNCFNNAPTKQNCILSIATKFQSVSCAFVSQISDDLNCIDKSRPDACDDAAIELFEPLKSESARVFDELKCTPISIINNTLSSTVINTIIKDNDNVEKHKNLNAQQVNLTQNHSTLLISTTTISNNINLSKTTIELLNSLNVSNNVVDLSNSLFAFSNTNLVCKASAAGATDIWAPIRAKICMQHEQIKKYTSCFNDTQRQIQQSCQSHLEKQTTCSAIDSFNKNVDCIINTLNDICPIEAREIVVNIQEKLNDEAINHKCYQLTSDNVNEPVNNDGFKLDPINARCSAEQENIALTCLVELVEINKQLPQLASVNFLLELSNVNSTIVSRICELYKKYNDCLNKNVFLNNKKCAFNSPLNTLARIGLSPICNPLTHQLLVKNHQCLITVAKSIDQSGCKSGLLSLGNTVELMLKGIHSEALLCKSFYLLEESFECGSKIISNKCDSQVVTDLNSIKEQISKIGVEEGCPAIKPDNLDSIIKKPVKSESSTSLLTSTISSVTIPQPCEAEAQKQFNECVRPLTAFQPHPLAVIKSPKDIDSACIAFADFKKCRMNLTCNPLWARGMSAMFEYTCGDGFEKYNNVKSCVRRITTRNDIRECVTIFSKSAPQEACSSANRILACSLPHISEKCGDEAVAFVHEYVQRFTTTIDNNCNLYEVKKLPPTTLEKSVLTFNCTADENQLVQQCAQPLNAIHTELEQLFEGGFQSFLKNVNNLTPIFAKGCALTKNFRLCATSLLKKTERKESQCVISSCFMKAGNGICNQEDVGAAIEKNLGCVFKQVSEPDFGKCLRSTISTLKHFSIESLRSVLPKFINCVEPLVVRSCGSIPLNVLKAFGSESVCPVTLKDNTQLSIVPVPTCNANLAQKYDDCVNVFTSKYDFAPIALLEYKTNNATDDTLCVDFESLSNCIENNRICEKPNKFIALRKLVARICSNKNAFDQRSTCLKNIINKNEGEKCLKNFNLKELLNFSKQTCAKLNQTIQCAAEKIFNECPIDTVPFVYDYTNGYLREFVIEKEDACNLVAPIVSLQTGCSEADLIRYLECESIIDKYRFQPISIIKNSSNWQDFCTAVKTDYRSCLKALPCKFEPAMSANLNLFEHACDNSTEIGAAQEKYSVCLADYVESKEGNVCIEKFRGVDILGRDVSSKICNVVDSILKCSAPALYSKCGPEAITHVYSLHQDWLFNFNSSCKIQQDSGLVLAELSKKIALTTLISIIETSSSISVNIDQTSQQQKIAIQSTPVLNPKLSTIVFEKQPTTTEKENENETTKVNKSTTTTSSTTQTITKNKITTTESSDNIKLRNRTVEGNGSICNTTNGLLVALLIILSSTIIIFN